MKILIKNGKLVDPANDMDAFYDVLIEEDKIALVSQDIDPDVLGEGDRLIDAFGKVVMPGFIDLHVHLREPGFEYKETIKTGCEAAARFPDCCKQPHFYRCRKSCRHPVPSSLPCRNGIHP